MRVRATFTLTKIDGTFETASGATPRAVSVKLVSKPFVFALDQAGMNTEYYANSIALGGGESCDVILDATSTPVGTYYLFTPMLDHLANDLENFGGLMTEVHVCNSVTGGSTFGNTCN
jgi:hypothetical protein